MSSCLTVAPQRATVRLRLVLNVGSPCENALRRERELIHPYSSRQQFAFCFQEFAFCLVCRRRRLLYARAFVCLLADSVFAVSPVRQWRLPEHASSASIQPGLTRASISLPRFGSSLLSQLGSALTSLCSLFRIQNKPPLAESVSRFIISRERPARR